MTQQNESDNSDMFGSQERINIGLLNSHIHFLNGPVNEYSVENVIKWILYENTIEEDGKILNLYINSEGGSLPDCLALIDIMKQSKYPIKTIGIGTIASASFLIFACGSKGKRIISKNTSIMCHQYSSLIQGKEHDLEAYYREMELTNTRLINILKSATSLNTKLIKTKLMPPSDVWLTPEELVSYGVADKIV